MADIQVTNEPPDKPKGLTFWMAVFFIAGNVSGGGLLVLPKALADTGWGGVFFITFCCINALYAAICLSRCWLILEERYEEYRQKNRYPYSAIAERAFGIKMRYVVSVCLHINFIGVGIVFLLLASELIAKLTIRWGISFCHWILIISAILCPIMWLGTPKDFWAVAVISVLTGVFSSVLLITCVSLHAMTTTLNPAYTPPTLSSFFLPLGIIYFSFGGAASFPTFQNDMKDKTQFPMAICTGFVVVFFMYFPVAVLSYAVYGASLHADVTRNLPDTAYRSMVYVLFGLRTLFAFILITNASCQEFEEFLTVPDRFGWKRVAVRVTILLFVLFVAVSIPRFGKILTLVGGSAITLASSVFPCLFYYKLCSEKNEKWPERFIPLYEKVYLVVIIISGVFGGCIATYSAFLDIINLDTFNPPCYINATAAGFGIDSADKVLKP